MTSWDDAAAWYLDMVRDPTQGFNHVATDLALDLLGPVRDRDVLDIGAGDGQLARRLAAAGGRVTATEPTDALRGAAIDAEAQVPLGVRYLADRAEDLASCDNASCDAVLAVLVLHHVADLHAAAAEICRVLRPGGAAIVVIPHPWTDHPDAAWRHTDSGPRRLAGTYLTERFWHTDEPNTIRAIGRHHRTLATLLTTLAHHQLWTEEVREPTGTDPRRPGHGGPWTTTPRLLALRLKRT